jgi:hypothetical protein
MLKRQSLLIGLNRQVVTAEIKGSELKGVAAIV